MIGQKHGLPEFSLTIFHYQKENNAMKQAIRLLTMITALASIFLGCGGEKGRGTGGRTEARSDVQEAAIKTYVAPGDMDKYYIFKSGGHSGQVYV